MINYNGQLFPDNTPIFSPNNRAFRYGDGLFESMRMSHGRIPLFSYHWDRLLSSIHSLKLIPPPHFNPDFLLEQIQLLCNGKGHWRIRLAVFRGDGGLYTPTNHQLQYCISAEKLSQAAFPIAKKGIHLGLCEHLHLPHSPLSPLKSSNRLINVMASIWQQEQDFDVAILLNSSKQIAETTHSNLFLFTDGKVLTPPLSAGCLDGVMRRYVLKQLPILDCEVLEANCTVEDLYRAKEIWLTNAIQGVQWVKQFKKCTFEHHNYLRLINQINESIA